MHALVDELRVASREMNTFCERQLETLAGQMRELDERAHELDRREQALNNARQQFEQQQHKLAEFRQLAEHAAWRAQQEIRRLGELNKQPGNVKPREPAAAGEEPDGCAAELRQALADAQAQLAAMAGLAAELSDARGEIVRLQGRLLKQNHRLAEAKANAPDPGPRMLELQHERTRLATELDAARQQLGDALRQAEEERRSRASERSVWLGEIKRLRETLEHNGPAHFDLGALPDAAVDVSLDEIAGRLDALEQDIDEAGRDLESVST